MKEDAKKSLIFGLIILFVILSTCLILSVKNPGINKNSTNNSNNDSQEEIMKCIAEKSVLYVSATCGHCANQKKILEDYIDKFNMVDCSTETEKCIENNIQAVPTWLINNEKYTGVHSVQQLKKLTGC